MKAVVTTRRILKTGLGVAFSLSLAFTVACGSSSARRTVVPPFTGSIGLLNLRSTLLRFAVSSSSTGLQASTRLSPVHLCGSALGWSRSPGLPFRIRPPFAVS